MRFEKLLLVSLVLLTIFTISAVSASDNITDDRLSADSSIELSDEELKTDEILTGYIDGFIDINEVYKFRSKKGVQ